MSYVSYKMKKFYELLTENTSQSIWKFLMAINSSKKSKKFENINMYGKW